MNPIDPTKYELFEFGTEQELTKCIASRWLDTVGAAARKRDPFYAALSGGRVAGRFFADLARQTRQRGASLSSVHFFWADERCVPPTDLDSNFRIAHEALLEPLAIPPQQIHRIRGELLPQTAASDAEQELGQIVPAGLNRQPALTLVLLGMGEDGHVASLFPGEPEEMTWDKRVYRAVHAGKPPPHRVTLGYQAIAAAEEVWLLISGPDKEKTLRSSLAGTEQTPLARVLQLRGHTRIFTDIRVRVRL